MSLSNFKWLREQHSRVKEGVHPLCHQFSGQLFSHSPEYLISHIRWEEFSFSSAKHPIEEVSLAEPKREGPPLVAQEASPASDDPLSVFQVERDTASDGVKHMVDSDEHHQLQWIDRVSSPECVFIGERPQDFSEESPHADLLSKMIVAMKLKQGEFSRLFLLRDQERSLEEQWKEAAMIVLKLRPKVVVVLGALCTRLALQRKERLSQVHGQEFHLTFESATANHQVLTYPVFHPDILRINPNMKRSTWLDLQKVMKILGRMV
jgi:DNA polymerase